jgi:tRNA(Ile2) C34 agmatinyltransferase TiaS
MTRVASMESSRFAETLEWNKNSSSELRVKEREDLMDRTTRCPKCGKRMVPVVTISGRTDLQCISCDDPAVKWAESPLTAPEKPIVPEPV